MNNSNKKADGYRTQPVYQAFYNRCEIIPEVYFRIPYDMPNYTPLVCCNFKFDTCKFTKVILPVKYIIYAFKSYS